MLVFRMSYVKSIAIVVVCAGLVVLSGPSAAEEVDANYDLADSGYEFNQLTPSAGQIETLDETLDIAMPEKWSMSFNVRDKILNTNKQTFKSSRRESGGAGLVFGIGVDYEF